MSINPRERMQKANIDVWKNTCFLVRATDLQQITSGFRVEGLGIVCMGSIIHPARRTRYCFPFSLRADGLGHHFCSSACSKSRKEASGGKVEELRLSKAAT